MMNEMSPQQRQYTVEQFLYQVADACDRQQWDRYLDFFSQDAEFHVPQWCNEHQYTRDPQREMSLIYYANRSGLEDRVFRIRTGKSAASTPMPRTLHLISNVQIEPDGDDSLNVSVNWLTHYTRFGETAHVYGRAGYRLCQQDGELKISRKHVLLLNDKIDSVLDFYHL